MALKLNGQVRLTKSEMDTMRQRADAAGQSHWFPHQVRDKGDLLQAEAAAEGSQLLDVLFGDIIDGDDSARKAYERGEIGTQETLGVSEAELEGIAKANRDGGPAQGE